MLFTPNTIQLLFKAQRIFLIIGGPPHKMVWQALRIALLSETSYFHNMADGINYITPLGFKKLQDEFKELFSGERPKLVETIAWAAGNGDRSENGDYIYGKRRLREIDKRLKFLRDRIESAQVIDPAEIKNTKVVFGATVTIQDEDDQTRVYKIVGEDEIEPGKNLISWKSPMAKALLGKATDDEVEIRKPAGVTYAVITKIEYK